MKIHYTNILLFPLKLNILVNTHKKPSITACHTQKIPTTRSLSECELYAPVNYYSDPQMKEVMDNFNKQTQQRFHEYDESMNDKRQKCYCLGGVAPNIGLLGGTGIYGWKIAALAAAKEEAISEGLTAASKTGIDYGIKYIITELKNQLGLYYIEKTLCSLAGEDYFIGKKLIDTSIRNNVGNAKEGADTLTAHVTTDTIVKFTDTKTAVAQAFSITYNTAIIASLVAIWIIVLVMVMIYSILRYRRKRKMKKNLQYINLLKE
ncbi:hypothetical protein PFAG_01874 [Plasmodium falciparum Santa Lucia]|uniref:Surface antigen n=1 Tax=Plasmodium falciparum Santa Lucia TaxID=478859 RepID=W7G0Y4_PLAFA|nr:hypothetical protein PFAG_01874 [Plasmodium falciparum Santa Lucia]